MIASPAPRRPTPGGGLAVLVVVTVLAALAGPHAPALRGLLARRYQADRAFARSAEGSPTHAQDRSSTSDGPVRYTAPSVIFEHADGSRFEVGFVGIAELEFKEFTLNGPDGISQPDESERAWL